MLNTEKNISTDVIERRVFKHVNSNTYLIADAYRGSKIKTAIEDFFAASSGNKPVKLALETGEIDIHGGADLIVYVGHNGLMDFDIDEPSHRKGANPKDVIVLSCKSKEYFHDYLAKLDARMVLLTNGLMAPEAYTLEAAIEAWLNRENGERIVEQAAAAYHKYQKCGIAGAKRLFYSSYDSSKDD